MSYEKLFEPIQIGKLTIKNRIALEPMLLEVGEHDGTAGDRLIAYYEERAKGGAGLIMTEVTRISDYTGTTGPRQLSVTSDRCIPSLTRLADAIHKYDAKIFVQLHHTGRQNLQMVVTAWKLSDEIGRRWDGWWKIFYSMTKYIDFFDSPFMHNFFFPVVSASDIPAGLGSSPVRGQKTRALTKWEINKIEDEFAAGAVRCKKAGIDGVELHASHGYLIQQFLSPYTNRRTDEYGGSTENRCRFIKEIIDKIRALCGPDYPIAVRLTVDEYFRNYGYDVGITLDEGIKIAKLIESYGADALDISSGTYDTMNTWLEPVTYECGWRKGNAAAVKKAVNIPVIAANLIRTPDQAEKQLEDGTQDMIGLGRPLLADPYWPQKAQEGRPEDIRRCICCLWCIESMYKGAMKDESGQCALNPRTCYENTIPKSPVKDGGGRMVAVIGAGPSGLTAAKTLLERGFAVTVFEINERPGGQLAQAAVPPHKEKLMWAVEDLMTACVKLGADIRFSTEAAYDNIKELEPYAVFNCAGGHTGKPRMIKGYDKENVYTLNDILQGSVSITKKNVAVIGSGMSGLETAETLAFGKNKVTVIEMADSIAPNTWKQHIDDIMPRLNEKGTKFYTSWKLVSVNDSSIEIESTKIPGLLKNIPCDCVVFAAGVSKNPIDEKIKSITSRYFECGDARQSGRIANAVHTAFDAAVSLK